MRAYSATDIMSSKFKRLDWSGPWEEAFMNPQATGMWCVWGNSGNGKTAFCYALAKALSTLELGNILINTHEEREAILQDTLTLHQMKEYKKVKYAHDTVEELTVRLKKRGSPKVVIFDSIEAAGLTVRQLKKLVADFPDRLFVFVARAEGEIPKSAAGKEAKYDADLKIQVKGFRGISHGRYNPGGYITIWEEGAAKFHGHRA